MIEEYKSLNQMEESHCDSERRSTAMSDREQHWFFLDRRLIFATDRPKVYREWLRSLNKLIS